MTFSNESAQKWKQMAESAFKVEEYESALRFANMAKDLDPNLYGIQQFITAYTVHVAASGKEFTINNNSNGHKKRKFNDTEKDWYAILGVLPDEDSVDTETIKKQYKKMAMMVHPDKNDSLAAEGAFKLISDAWNVLSNQSTRISYDLQTGRGLNKRRRTTTWPKDVPPEEEFGRWVPPRRGTGGAKNRSTGAKNRSTSVNYYSWEEPNIPDLWSLDRLPDKFDILLWYCTKCCKASFRLNSDKRCKHCNSFLRSSYYYCTENSTHRLFMDICRWLLFIGNRRTRLWFRGT